MLDQDSDYEDFDDQKNKNFPKVLAVFKLNSKENSDSRKLLNSAESRRLNKTHIENSFTNEFDPNLGNKSERNPIELR